MATRVIDVPIFRKSREIKSNESVGLFLEGLGSNDNSLEKRAYSAKFISQHHWDIERYFQESNLTGNLDGFNRIKRQRRLVEEYGEMPSGYDFDLKTATLRKNPGFFSIEPPFTRNLGSKISKTFKYLLSVALISGALYISYEGAKFAEKIIKDRAEIIQYFSSER